MKKQKKLQLLTTIVWSIGFIILISSIFYAAFSHISWNKTSQWITQAPSSLNNQIKNATVCPLHQEKDKQNKFIETAESRLSTILQVLSGIFAMILALFILRFEKGENSYTGRQIGSTPAILLFSVSFTSIFTFYVYLFKDCSWQNGLLIAYSLFFLTLLCLTLLIFIRFLPPLLPTFIKRYFFNQKLWKLEKYIKQDKINNHLQSAVNDICMSIKSDIKDNYEAGIKMKINCLCKKIKNYKKYTEESKVKVIEECLNIFIFITPNLGKTRDHISLKQIITELAPIFKNVLIAELVEETKQQNSSTEKNSLKIILKKIYMTIQEIFDASIYYKVELAIEENLNKIDIEAEKTVQQIKKSDNNYDKLLIRKLYLKALRYYLLLYSHIGKISIHNRNKYTLTLLLGQEGIFEKTYKIINDCFVNDDTLTWQEMKEINQIALELLSDGTKAEMDNVVANGFYMLVDVMSNTVKKYFKIKKINDPIENTLYISEKYSDMISAIISTGIENKRFEVINTGIASLMDIINKAIQIIDQKSDKNSNKEENEKKNNLIDMIVLQSFSIVLFHTRNLLLNRSYRKQVSTSHFGYRYNDLYTLTQFVKQSKENGLVLMQMYGEFLSNLLHKHLVEMKTYLDSKENPKEIENLPEPLPTVFMINTFGKIYKEACKKKVFEETTNTMKETLDTLKDRFDLQLSLYIKDHKHGQLTFYITRLKELVKVAESYRAP